MALNAVELYEMDPFRLRENYRVIEGGKAYPAKKGVGHACGGD